MELQGDYLPIDVMIDMRDRLRLGVERTGVKQAEIARRVGITPQRLNNYINRGTLPDVETLAKLAKALRVSTDWLLGFSGSVPAEVRPIVARLLELDGLEPIRATAIADAVQEAVKIVAALPDEGDAALRSRIAAQTVWQSRSESKPAR